MSAEGAGPDGRVAFSARAVFRVVNRSHFERFGPAMIHPGLRRLHGAGG